MRKEIGNKLKEQRKEMELTQMDLAELSGLDKSTISRIENGSAYPSMKTLMVFKEIGFINNDIFLLSLFETKKE